MVAYPNEIPLWCCWLGIKTLNHVETKTSWWGALLLMAQQTFYRRRRSKQEKGPKLLWTKCWRSTRRSGWIGSGTENIITLIETFLAVNNLYSFFHAKDKASTTTLVYLTLKREYTGAFSAASSNARSFWDVLKALISFATHNQRPFQST